MKIKKVLLMASVLWLTFEAGKIAGQIQKNTTIKVEFK